MAKYLARRGVPLALLILLSMLSVLALAACTGEDGAQGLQGSQGPAGVAGDSGSAGPQGPAGSSGGTGPKGSTGAQGPEGPAGRTGAAGAAGSDGAAGATGSRGSSGFSGPPGQPGEAAVSPYASVVAALVETGGTTTVWGSGFTAGESISLAAGPASGGSDVVLGSATANASGAFTADVTVDLSPGVYSLWAIGDGGSQASGPLAVVAEK